MTETIVLSPLTVKFLGLIVLKERSLLL